MLTDQAFVSLAPSLSTVDDFPPPVKPRREFDHRVQFYEADDFLYRVVIEFFIAGQAVGEPLAVFATETHRQGLRHHLTSAGFDVDRLCASGDLAMFDARDTLSTFVIDGLPDPDLFKAQIGNTVAKLRAASRNGCVRAFGEMVDLLWRDGETDAMVALEKLWNDLGREGSLSLLCSYSMTNFLDHAHGGSFQRICDAHAHVGPTEAYTTDGDAALRLREISALQQRARSLEGEVEHRKRLEHVLREALAERGRAEQALRVSQQELVDFFENAAEGLHWVGPDGVILTANRAELQLLGYSKEEYVGHHIAEFHVDPEVISDILTRLTRNETVTDREARLRCKDRSIKHVLIHANVYFRDGEFIHTRCFTRDISDRKRLEDDLRRQNDELSRTVRFSEMFVGILGHDLRNPLSAITTAASLLRKRGDSDKVVKPATRILNSAGRMGRMIDQLLDFTRIRLGKGIPIQHRRTDLGEICRLAADEFESTGEAKRLKLEITGDSVGLWDADRLLQLVSNLLSNALTHGEPGGEVVMRLDGSGDEVVSLEVRNAGVVPPEVLPVLFEPFRSGANEKQERSNGLGLGLFISHQIVLGHSATIDVSSSEQEGTRLVVTLPRTPRPEPALGFAGGQP